MALTSISFLVIVFAAVCIEHGLAGFCTSSYTCTDTCYKRTCKNSWFRRRCTNVAYKCDKTCYKKVCCSGFKGSNCDQDIDECALNHDNCKQVCINTKGSFRCSCNSGFILQPDGCTCKGHWCKQTYQCNTTCYKKISSGRWWRKKVNTVSYTCKQNCQRDVCCSGWSGLECSIPAGK